MVVPTLCTDDIPVNTVEPIIPIIVSSANNFSYQLPGTLVNSELVLSSAPLATMQTLVPTGFADVVVQSKFANFNTSGAMFTGLSASTTLTINSIFYIERFPQATDSNLVVLAKPSPPYDPVAKACYSHMMQTMPVGVKVSENDGGEWFLKTVASLFRFLKGPLSMVPEVGPFLAGGAELVVKLAESNKHTKATPNKKANWKQISDTQIRNMDTVRTGRSNRNNLGAYKTKGGSRVMITAAPRPSSARKTRRVGPPPGRNPFEDTVMPAPSATWINTNKNPRRTNGGLI